MPASSPERSGGGAGKWRKACNYVSEIWISTFETLIGEDDISNDVTWYVFITLKVSQGLASCKKFLVLFSGTWIRIPWAEFRISKLRIPVSMSKNFPDFPLIGAKVYYRFQCSCYCFSLNSVFYVWGPFTMRLIIYERQNKKQNAYWLLTCGVTSEYCGLHAGTSLRRYRKESNILDWICRVEVVKGNRSWTVVTS